jgi:DNA gyrase subunit A
MLIKLLPTEMIVSCCPYQNEKHIYLVSKQGIIICINANEIYYANEYSLGYLNERTQLKNDYFLKVLPSNQYLDIETNKDKSARLNFDKINFKSNKTNFLIDLLKLEKGEHLENCFRLENFIN